ncbi:MAG: CHC2 zinc finger domain-containing protein [Candidatus Aenigmatarchaeota archaeon]
MRHNYLDMIEQVLREKGINFKRFSKCIMTKCFFHEEEVPSMALYFDGHYHCYGCQAHGLISKLLKIDLPIEHSAGEMKRLLEERILASKILEVKLPEGNEIEENVRGIRSQTLKKFNVYTDSEGIIVPVFYYSAAVGYTKRFFESQDGIKYMHSPGLTVYGKHFSAYCYPFYIRDKSPVVLVEGIFDMLALRDKGFNAYCMWSSNFQQFKASYVLQYLPKKIVIFFDPDDAGRKGALFYKNYFQRFVPTFIFESDKDPDEYVKNSANLEKLKKFVTGGDK